MDLELNPFTPGSGLRPPALEGRNDQIEAFDLLVARSKRRNYDRGMILSGLRGVGKTSLLNYLAHHADNQGWLTISIEGRPSTSGIAAVRNTLAQELSLGLRRYSRKQRLKDSVDDLIALARNFSVGVSVAGATVNVSAPRSQIDSGDIAIDLEELVEAICEVLRPRNSAFGLFIDEMQDLDQDLLTALLAVQHKANQRQWPFYVVGAGLPNLPAVLADCRSYAERQFLYSTIGPLAPVDAADALRIPVQAHGGDFTPEALDVLVETSGGYPYFLQEYGKAIWNIAPGTPFELADALGAVEVGRRHLDDGFFPSRWDRATPRERKYLAAMSTLGEDQPRSAKVAAAMGSTAAGTSEVRDSAIKRGLIWAPERGRIAFTVPGMADFIRRQQLD
ncbi:ATP-binding protein [Rhodococcus sp. IEGM 1366]|uniref:ATP-binding protein n=1 Tax=Rhodococcus sp. IEGM 1366 TaxID=3082223 RepID=UPI002954C0FF|nr:ATP-binding protein [Rhodococcus sp. IEGM 1366]MDV8071385.1 ATP-binding protein [Rhodococcus sp. IEGM 1366]